MGRDVDGDLQNEVRAAVVGTEPRIVVVFGASKVGKSRTLFEALAWYDREVAPLQLVAPDVELEVVKNLLKPSGQVVSVEQSAVLWLDDLEPFLDKGVNVNMLLDWCAHPGRIVAATLGGTGGDDRMESPIAGLKRPADRVLDHARKRWLGKTTITELQRLDQNVSEAELQAVREPGLAAYLVAGPKMAVKLETGRHPGKTRECREGQAVVLAAIDWARCGRTSLIGEHVLRSLWPLYLPDWIDDTDDNFASALRWARQPVANIAMLQKDRRTGDYRAYDYVVRVKSSQPGAASPPEEVWATALDTAALPTEAFAVGDAAFLHGPPELALRAFSVSSRAPELARDAEAWMHWIVFFNVEYRDPDDRTSYNPEALGRFVDEYYDNHQLRGLVADVLVEQAKALRWDRREEALRAYRLLAALCTDDDGNPEMRVKAVDALNQQAQLHGELNEPDEGLKTYQRVLDSYENDRERMVRYGVANALAGMADLLARRGSFTEARQKFQRVIDQYPDLDLVNLDVNVECKLIFIGDSFLQLDQPKDALDTYEQIINGCATTPLGRDRVAAKLESMIKAYGGDPARNRGLADRTISLLQKIREPELQ
jgi:tetratricopeptide (TPR) repeat protein